MSATNEQRRAFESLRALPGRFKVTADSEGWPVIIGRLGQIEWFCDGVDCHSCPLPGQVALAVYTDRPRMFAKLRAIPGVRRHQTGDTEMRAVFPASALPEVATVVGAHRKRTLSPRAIQNLVARLPQGAASATQDALGAAAPTHESSRPPGIDDPSTYLRRWAGCAPSTSAHHEIVPGARCCAG